jgi:hypothetical protein
MTSATKKYFFSNLFFFYLVNNNQLSKDPRVLIEALYQPKTEKGKGKKSVS